MPRPELERVNDPSPDLNEERLEALRDLFPEAFAEGKLDVDKLREALGEAADDRPERYSFTWAGKRQAIQSLQRPASGALAPDPENSVNWDETANVFIEGENLEVLKLLYRSYFGRVKMIYIDPPYNTGHDFVYPDDYSDPLGNYLRATGQMDGDGNLLTSNPEASGRYHSAWLSMMYPRLFLARQLLREDGVIFVSIDDNEVHNLRMLMNEVFGEESFLASVCWQKRYSRATDATEFSDMHDYILVYGRRGLASASAGGGSVVGLLPRTSKQDSLYSNPDDDPRGMWASDNYRCNKSAEERPNLYYAITNPTTGEQILPSRTSVWRYSREQHEAHVRENRIWWGSDGRNSVPRYKRFLSEVGDLRPTTWWSFQEAGHNDEAKKEYNSLFPGIDRSFDTPKPVRLLKRIAQIGSTPVDARTEPDLVLDFFSGSSTTAQAVLELNREDGGNRRFIMVQIPEPLGQPQTLDDGTVLETIADIGRERIRRVIKKMREQSAQELDLGSCEQPEDLGFRAYRLTRSDLRTDDATAGLDEGQPTAFAEPLYDDWTEEKLLAETTLREGLDLSSRVVTVEEVTANKVYRVTDPWKEQTCFVCLDNKLSPDTSRQLGLTMDDLFIVRDSALDDTLAANLALQCKLKVI